MSNLKVTVPLKEITETVRGKKVGVLTNGSFWLEEAGDSLAGVVKEASAEAVLLYAEHGIRGDEGPDSPAPAVFDEYMQCETRGLYDFTGTDNADTIRDLDLVMVGVHDIGTRHYSYKRTMCRLMEFAVKAGKAVVVIDAPNPVGGDKVEGNLGDPAFFSEDPELKRLMMDYGFFAAPIPYRHGMTMGELALLARDHLKLDLDLRIIKMEGWRRDMWWDDTGWPYIPFDPSISTADTALDFLCTGLFQGTTVSWGIGTADSFRVIGAPWIKDDRLLRAMQQRSLTGVTWTRAHFMPRWSEPEGDILWRRFCHEPCNGVRFHFTDRNAVCTSEVQLSLLVECLRLFPEEFDFMQEYRGLDFRLEDKQWARRLKAGEGVDSILAEWKAMSKTFEEARKPYLLY